MQNFGRRLLGAVVMIYCAGTLVFFAVRLLPGDPVLLLLGETGASDPAALAQMRQRLGLDRSFVEQYVHWLAEMAQLNFGLSLATGQPVLDDLAARIPRTLELIGLGVAVAALIGIPLGLVAARNMNRVSGMAASMIAVVGFSSPVFVTGIVLVTVFSLWLQILPSSGYVPFSEDPGTHLSVIVMPALSVGLTFAGVIARMTRASLSDTLGKDYVRLARAKGLTRRQATMRHALPNALVPVVSIIGIRAGNLLGGMVIVEALFNWPGLSSLLVSACVARDYPVIQATMIAIFAIFIALSLVLDMVQAAMDPRIGREAS